MAKGEALLAERPASALNTGTAARIAGAALIAVSILEIAAMAHHPSVHAAEVAEAITQLRALSALSAWVHGILIALMLVGFFALTEFALRRGLARPVIRAGLIAYAVGVIAMTGAALVSGFITPAVAVLPTGAGAADLASVAQLLRLCMLMNQALARLGAVAMSLGILAWSLDLLRGARAERALAVIGIGVGLGCTTALIADALHLDVHGMMLVVVLQAAWTAGLGALLVSTRSELPATAA